MGIKRAVGNKLGFVAPNVSNPKSNIKYGLESRRWRSRLKVAFANTKRQLKLFKESLVNGMKRKRSILTGFSIKKKKAAFSTFSGVVNGDKWVTKMKQTSGMQIPRGLHENVKAKLRKNENGLVFGIDAKYVKDKTQEYAQLSKAYFKALDSARKEGNVTKRDELRQVAESAKANLDGLTPEYESICLVCTQFRMSNDSMKHAGPEALANMHEAAIRTRAVWEARHVFGDGVAVARDKIEARRNEVLDKFNTVVDALNLKDAHSMIDFLQSAAGQKLSVAQKSRMLIAGTSRMPYLADSIPGVTLKKLPGLDFYIQTVKERIPGIGREGLLDEAVKLQQKDLQVLKPAIEEHSKQVMRYDEGKDGGIENPYFNFSRSDDAHYLQAVKLLEKDIDVLAADRNGALPDGSTLLDYIETYGDEVGIGLGVDKEKARQRILKKYGMDNRFITIAEQAAAAV